MRPEIFARFAFPILLVSFVLLALAYSVTIPLGEAPDEVPHWSYVQYLVANRALPKAEGAVSGETHQPPLYYLLGALATFWIPQADFQIITNPDFTFDNPRTPNLLLHLPRENFPYHGGALAWHLVRVLSIAMGAVTIWAMWQLARAIFREETWIAIGATAFVAFLPGFVSISAVVNNDNLIVMLSTLSVLQIFQMIQQPLKTHDTVILGILLGLAVMAKVSGLVAWFFVAAMFFYIAFKTGEWKSSVAYGALCFAIAGVIIVPWVIYNWLTNGDPLGWSLYLSVASLRPEPPTWSAWAEIARGLFTSFWGRFGGALLLSFPTRIYVVLAIATALSGLGWIGYGLDVYRHKADSKILTVFFLFVLFWFPLLAAYLRWAAQDLAAGQARLIFPALPLLAICLVVGFARVFGEQKKFALALAGIALISLAVATIFFLNSIYAQM